MLSKLSSLDMIPTLSLPLESEHFYRGKSSSVSGKVLDYYYVSTGGFAYFAILIFPIPTNFSVVVVPDFALFPCAFS